MTFYTKFFKIKFNFQHSFGRVVESTSAKAWR